MIVLRHGRPSRLVGYRGRHARRRLLSATTAGLLGLGCVVATGVAQLPAPPASAAVAVDQVFPVPPGGDYQLDGHGFGHGIGLSQWGAEYGAQQGASYTKILDFYYPGTTMATVSATQPIRVLITEAAPNQVVVQASSGLTITDSATGKSLAAGCPASGHQLTSWGVAATAGSSPAQMLFAFYSGGYIHCPGTFAGPIVFGDPNGVQEVFADGSSRLFDGSLAAVTMGSSSLAAVNTLPLDDYVAGVVPRESPAYWPAAALQAQAVAARSYAVDDMNQQYPTWDICDSTYCQVYGGVETYNAQGQAEYGESTSSTQATTATAGQVLEYDGQVILAMYSASNGGYSVSGNEPYLPAQPDPWDVGSPEHDWTAQITAAQVEADYPQLGALQDLTVTSRDGNGQWQGRVLQVQLQGSSGSLTLSGSAFSGALGLMSNWWTVDPATYSGALQPGFPVAGVWQGNSSLTLAARSASGGVATVTWTAGAGWSAPQPLGGAIDGVPGVAVGPNGVPEVSATGTNRGGYVRPVTGGAWSAIGGTLTSSLSAVSWGPGRFSVFGQGTDGALWVRTYIDGWHPWSLVGGVLAAGTGAAAVSASPGQLSVFVTGVHGIVYERDYGPQGWNEWVDLGEPAVGTPAAASGGAGGVMVLAGQSGGGLAVATGRPDALGAFAPLSGSFSSGPGVAAWPAADGERYDAFAWSGNSLLQSTSTGQGWTAWATPF